MTALCPSRIFAEPWAHSSSEVPNPGLMTAITLSTILPSSTATCSLLSPVVFSCHSPSVNSWAWLIPAHGGRFRGAGVRRDELEEHGAAALAHGAHRRLHSLALHVQTALA